MTDVDALRAIVMYRNSTPELKEPSGKVAGNIASSPNKATSMDFASKAVCKHKRGALSINEQSRRRLQSDLEYCLHNYLWHLTWKMGVRTSRVTRSPVIGFMPH